MWAASLTEGVLSGQSRFPVIRARDWRKESRIPRLVSGVTTTSAVPHCLALVSLAYGHF